mmetsp:Transcript_6158/g.13909  ORF Transcript_6158/g.13909 Transcript_6158/m.13909 type:complete len:297 (+) Transcript_6158:618-1508(+)
MPPWLTPTNAAAPTATPSATGGNCAGRSVDCMSVAISTYSPAADPYTAPPSAAAMASSPDGGGFGGGVGSFEPKGSEIFGRLGRLGRLGRSIIDFETSSDRSGPRFLALGGGLLTSDFATSGALAATGSTLATGFGSTFTGSSFLTTTGSGFFATGVGLGFSGSFFFSTSGSFSNWSLKPGMKSPVVDPSVSSSSSSSDVSDEPSLSPGDSANRHIPLTRGLPLMMHRCCCSVPSIEIVTSPATSDPRDGAANPVDVRGVEKAPTWCEARTAPRAAGRAMDRIMSCRRWWPIALSQ